jgi:hypothetical protein
MRIDPSALSGLREGGISLPMLLRIGESLNM